MADKKSEIQKLNDAIDRKVDAERIRSELIADRLFSRVTSLSSTKRTFQPKDVKTKNIPEEVCLMLSDFHLGYEFTLEETGGICEYNYDVFKKRLATLRKNVTEKLSVHLPHYKKKVLNVFVLGDIVAGTPLGGAWEAAYTDMPIKDQVVKGFENISSFVYYFSSMFDNINVYCVRGNHGRCFTPDTKVLTKRGYKFYNELLPDDLVGTLNSNGKFEFNEIKRFHVYDIDEDIVCYKNNYFRMNVTKDHDVLYKNRHTGGLSKLSAGELLKRNSSADYKIPICGEIMSSEEKDNFNFDDNLLKLLGWIMSDGSYDNEQIRIYQSKPENLSIIKSIIESNKISYKLTSRERKNINILDKKIKMSHDENCFYLHSSEKTRLIRKELLFERESIPQWMFSLSRKQVLVWLTELVRGDGSFRNGEMDVLWGNKDFLEKVCALLISKSIACSIKKHKRKNKKYLRSGKPQCNYYLQFRKTKNYHLISKKLYSESYKGKVWCLETKNGNIGVISEIGSPYFSGNCEKQKTEKDYCNWDNVCYDYIKLRFKDVENITVQSMDSFFQTVEINGYKFLLLHGDKISGTTSLSKLEDAQLKISAMKREFYDYILSGHFHVSQDTSTTLGKAIINGSFLGGDIFSVQSLQQSRRPEQKLFAVNKKEGISWHYDIPLE